jgi:dihydroorotase
LRRTRQAAEAIGKPAMVHVGGTVVPLAALLAMLRPGDVVTHCYHDRTEGGRDDHGKVRPAVWQASECGILFDVGHGAGSFTFGVARRALAQGLLPGTISSDIHAWSVAEPVYDLATTASKFLHLEIPLAEVLRRVTSNLARAVGWGGRIGTLAPGAVADVSLLRLVAGEWPFRDTAGRVEIGERRLGPVAVIRAGRHYPCQPAVYAPVAGRRRAVTTAWPGNPPAPFLVVEW